MTNAVTHPQLRRYIESLGGPRDFAARHGLSQRIAERLYSGARDPSPSLTAEIAAAIAVQVEAAR